MSAKSCPIEVWLASGRFRIAINTYRDSNLQPWFGYRLWVPFGFRKLGGRRYSLDFFRCALKLEDYKP